MPTLGKVIAFDVKVKFRWSFGWSSLSRLVDTYLNMQSESASYFNVPKQGVLNFAERCFK